MLEVLHGLAPAIGLESIIAMLIGTAAGIVVGAIPGLTATLAMALLLPFTYTMAPLTSLGMMAGIYNGSMYGGAIPAILLKIPGTPSAVATTFDGPPLVREGRGKFALHVALVASTAGSVISALSLMLLAPPLVTFSLRFGPVEYFWVAIFGMTAVSLLLADAPAKGIAAGLLGIAVGIVGQDMMTGTERLVFGVRDLAGGISIAVLLTGLFAVPPALAMLAPVDAGGDVRDSLKGAAIRLREAIALWPTLIRSGVIGVIIGIMPGAGGNLAGILSYSEVKRSARDQSRFGKGDPRGIAASECGNNADNASSLIPTLALGVPGNSVAALMMGAMLIQGLNPGPALFAEHPDVVYGFMWQMLITAFIMLIMGFAGAALFVQMLRIPTAILSPMILIVCSIGTYAAGNSIVDVWLMLGFGGAAYLLSRAGYPMAPVVLGAILGPLAENSFRQALLITRGNPLGFVSSTVSIVLVLAILLVLGTPLLRWLRRDRRRDEPSIPPASEGS